MTLNPRLDVLPPAQKQVWDLLGEFSNDFVLYGGTAIALRLGHRSSVDFDFFSSSELDADVWLRESVTLVRAEVLQRAPNTLTVSIPAGEPVKLSLFGGISFGRVAHPDVTQSPRVRVASTLDLLASKLKVLLQRIEIKDYLDVEAILRSGVALEQGLGAAQTLYGRAFPPMECVKALTYFEEGPVRNLPAGTRRFLEAVVAGWNGTVDRVPRISESLI